MYSVNQTAKTGNLHHMYKHPENAERFRTDRCWLKGVVLIIFLVIPRIHKALGENSFFREENEGSTFVTAHFIFLHTAEHQVAVTTGDMTLLKAIFYYFFQISSRNLLDVDTNIFISSQLLTLMNHYDLHCDMVTMLNDVSFESARMF